MRSLLTYLAVVALTAGLGSEACAYTTRFQVTPDYVRKHPDQWSVKVAKKNGLIEFTIVWTLPQPNPMWQGARLVVHHAGKVIAESHSVVRGRKEDYFLQFALFPEDLAKSTLEFVECYSSMSADDAMQFLNLRERPVFPLLRGSALYRFQLEDLAREGLRETGGGKHEELREPGSRVQQLENRIRELEERAKTVTPEESSGVR